MVLSASIGALGALGSAGLGLISANHQSGKAYQRAIGLMHEQARLNYQYAQKSAENSPTWNRQGLESAGYNPMLAVQNATSGANSSWTSSQGYQQDQATDVITNGVRNGTEMAQLAMQQKQTDSTVALNESQARKNIAESSGIDIHNKYLDAREQKELGRIDAETKQLTADTNYKSAMIDAIDKNIELQREIALLQSATGINIANIGSNATKYAADKSFDSSKYSTDNNMIKAGLAGILGTAGLIYGPAKLKALRLLGKTKAIGF